LRLAVPPYITTYAAQTTQTQASGNIAGTGFTSTSTAGTAVVGTLNTSGLSLGIPPYITTYVGQTTQTQAAGGIAGSGFTTFGTGGTAIVGTHDSNGLYLGVPPYLTTAIASSLTQISFFNPFPAAQTTAGLIGANLVAVQQLALPPTSFSRVNLLVSVSLSTSSNSSYAGTISLFGGMYSRNGSTLSLISQANASYAFTVTGSNSSASYSGLRLLSIGIPTNNNNNQDRWIAFMSNTASANANWFTAVNAFVTAQTNQIAGWGAATNSTNQSVLGNGLWSTTTAGAMPSSMAFSDIRGAGVGAFATQSAAYQLPIYFNAVNVTA
jgi:hypothetical protein